jgi:hypothetical protein
MTSTDHNPGPPVYRIFNQGEIPALADGWRSVVALSPGRKWITIIDWTTLETARLDVTSWHRLKPEPHAAVKLRAVRSVMRRRLKYITPTQAIRDPIRLLGGRP